MSRMMKKEISKGRLKPAPNVPCHRAQIDKPVSSAYRKQQGTNPHERAQLVQEEERNTQSLDRIVSSFVDSSARHKENEGELKVAAWSQTRELGSSGPYDMLFCLDDLDKKSIGML